MESTGCTCVIINGEYRSTVLGGCPVHGGRSPIADDPVLTAEAQKHVIKELSDKIQHLVDAMDANGRLEDHAYTFPDGDVWKAKDSDLDKLPPV